LLSLLYKALGTRPHTRETYHKAYGVDNCPSNFMRRSSAQVEVWSFGEACLVFLRRSKLVARCYELLEEVVQ
jgi:hypothetical protein